ncbi:MAG: hypothetical protein JSW17_03760 [Candidatus Omnitrophota bacterium]|nr:MAG: hypothetical protein JSW17_03760 [Candidatus Omnitrophota bacterium]
MGQAKFNFKEVTEQEEGLDFSKKVPCPHCKKPIPYNATMCLYCGETVTTPTKPSPFMWVIVGVVIIGILFMLFKG